MVKHSSLGLVYRVGADPTLPAASGGCVLYALGYDGIDDGGVRPAEHVISAYDTDVVGVDDVFFGSASEDLEGASR